ncbi:MAG TPA: tetratricopeptide repeat protein [Polaromonas sp.]|uniref:O-linked N-acetylglucosamine transferase family protein n=1 Tax=Polaromonas sp. TaxID=1869339 RepID=UPI002D58ADC2|nr:tetratricopeptide repeat protein [Polaromonas sp.]HYW57920.1 tetratricopeptide repeat protein [Polaromonas sp.]
MQTGSRLHAGGQAEEALLAFENALALQPQDLNTASACAALLSSLGRPLAAYNTLLSVQDGLLATADGTANLAIAAEVCGDIEKAQHAYQRALAVDPDHLRSLNNVGLLAARNSQWGLAVSCARRCVTLDPAQAAYHAHLSDALCGARDYASALEVLSAALGRFPQAPALLCRRIVVLAFQGELAEADAARAELDTSGQHHFEGFLANWRDALADSGPSSGKLPDNARLFLEQAFEALDICDWRGLDQLTATLRQLLDADLRQGRHREWHSAGFHAQALALTEDELVPLSSPAEVAPGALVRGRLSAFVHRKNSSLHKDGRIHVGLAVPDLHDCRQLEALKQHVALHDALRFAFHTYSFASPLLSQLGDLLLPHAGTVVELGHMTDAEAAGRIRLDQLDVFVDMTADAKHFRPAIAALRVAPVQLRQSAWNRRHMPGCWDYIVSDHWIHPDGPERPECGAVARLPLTCWLATNHEKPEPGENSRQACGIPEDRLVLSSMLTPVNIDPESFAIWMKVLRELPDAVLWLASCNLATATNLAREAEAAGVNASRLLFAAPMSRTHRLAALGQSDLFLDPLRFNAGQGLADAVRLGVAAITCSGQSMASRIGGSILRAAEIPQCVFDSPRAYAAEAVRMGRNVQVLQSARRELQMSVPSAPLFDVAARVREWETAWTVMVERTRAGLPAAAFDVEASA